MIKKAYDDRKTAPNSQSSMVGSAPPSDGQDLFKPDFLDIQFDRIDRELTQERQQREIMSS